MILLDASIDESLVISRRRKQLTTLLVYSLVITLLSALASPSALAHTSAALILGQVDYRTTNEPSTERVLDRLLSFVNKRVRQSLPSAYSTCLRNPTDTGDIN